MAGPLSLPSQLLIIGLLGGGAFYGWQEQDRLRGWIGMAQAQDGPAAAKQRNRGAAPVIVAPVRTAADTLRLEAVGTGFAIRSVMLRAEASGRVAASQIAAGRVHRAGDVLLQMDDREQRLAMQLALTTYGEAERTRTRLARLSRSGVTAATSLDEATTAAELAKIQLERSRDAVTDRVLKAPFDGISGLPSVEPGDWIDAGDTVASFDDRRILLVEFDLPETLLGRASVGLPVSATTPLVPGRTFSGRVRDIDSRVDAGSRAARVRVAIPNEDDLLRPGISFTVELVLEGEIHPLVPELALQFSRGALYVWRVSGDTVERVEVGMVRRLGGTVLVDGPLGAGDRVVVEGTQRLSDGREIEILDTGGTS